MKRPWLNEIKDRFDDYRIDPPDRLWGDIEADLDIGVRKRFTFRRLAAIAAACVALSAGVAVSLIDPVQSVVSDRLSTVFMPERSVRTLALLPTRLQLLALADLTDGSEVRRAIIESSREVKSNDGHGKPITTLEDMPATEEIAENLPDSEKAGKNMIAWQDSDKAMPAQQDAGKDTEVQHKSGKDELQRVSVDSEEPLRQVGRYDDIIVKTDLRSRLSLGLYASAGGVGDAFGGTASVPREGILMNDPGSDGIIWGDSYLLGVIACNNGKSVRSTTKHHLPVATGLSVKYDFCETLGLTVGLTYTYLSSEMFDGSDESYVASKQRLHYIGIPVKLNWYLYRRGRWGLYASGGVSTEKCVAGRVGRDYVIDRRLMDSADDDVDEKPLQWSVGVSAGVQFSVSDRASLFAEPGLSYYFDDGTHLKTVYKNHPLNFDLNVGFRFTVNK